MGKYTIQTYTDNCTGCLRCQLACSASYTGTFNPIAARIWVEVSGVTCSIRFTEDCKGCGICADNCFYDALRKKPAEDTK